MVCGVDVEVGVDKVALVLTCCYVDMLLGRHSVIWVCLVYWYSVGSTDAVLMQ